MKKLTKTDMARVILMALWNSPSLPAADYGGVKIRVKRCSRDTLKSQYKLAVAALKSVGREVPDLTHA